MHLACRCAFVVAMLLAAVTELNATRYSMPVSPVRLQVADKDSEEVSRARLRSPVVDSEDVSPARLRVADEDSEEQNIRTVMRKVEFREEVSPARLRVADEDSEEQNTRKLMRKVEYREEVSPTRLRVADEDSEEQNTRKFMQKVEYREEVSPARLRVAVEDSEERDVGEAEKGEAQPMMRARRSNLGPCNGLTSKPAVNNCKRWCRLDYGCNDGKCHYSNEMNRIRCTCYHNGSVC